MSMTTVEYVDRILASRGMSRRKLALKANISPSTLQSAMERGSFASRKMIERIAKVLEVPVELLVHESRELPVEDLEAFKDRIQFLLDEAENDVLNGNGNLYAALDEYGIAALKSIADGIVIPTTDEIDAISYRR